MLQTQQITVIGTGLLGTSIGLGLKKAGYDGRIVGVGRRRHTLDAALARGAFDDVATDYGQAINPESLVVVAVPLGQFPGVFDGLAREDVAPCVVTDVGSTKAMVMREAKKRLRADQPFVGSHPMAGNERQGPSGARADLFEGKPCIITTQGQTRPFASLRTGVGDGGENTSPFARRLAQERREEVVGLVESLWTTLGMSILHMSAEEHDRCAASVSHLPHLASVLLIHTAAKLGGWELASTGFRDTTRVASSNPPMRADIIAANRGHILDALRAYREQLDNLAATLENEDDAALLTWLEEAKHTRDEWLDQSSKP